MNVYKNILLYCRAGFEPECAQEIEARAAEHQLFGYSQLVKGGGFVEFKLSSVNEVKKVLHQIELDSLIFCRQWTAVSSRIKDLDRQNRVTPIIEALMEEAVSTPNLHTSLCQSELLSVDCPESEEHASLKTFCRKFTAPMAKALRDNSFMQARPKHKKESEEFDSKQGFKRVLFFPSFDEVYIGYQLISNASSHYLGISRLKLPPNAPSRSTLKLEEAWHQFIPKDAWFDYLGGAKKAVDLGAAPGGWTWQLVDQGMSVRAVDNGPMNESLMATEQVEHVLEDGFIFVPYKNVDWMVCDIADKPIRVIHLMSKWLVSEWCRFTVFNLKLPMKKRYPEVMKCLGILENNLSEAGIKYRLSAKQLYHDREEITCFVERL